MSSADQAAKKRQITAAEYQGHRSPTGDIPLSSSNRNSLTAPGQEERMTVYKHSTATWGGITDISPAKGGQFPEVIPFKVWED